MFLRRFRYAAGLGLALLADDPAAGGGGGAADPANPPAAAGLTQADLDAAVSKATAALTTQFAEQFKAATGHDSPAAFQEAEAKRKGETDKLLETRNQELAQTRAELAKTHINNAILAAAGAAVDPGDLVALLAHQGKFDSGQVTINGKPPAEAVAELLKAKPHLAKPTGNQGSGAGQQSEPPGQTDLKAQYAAAKAKGDVARMMALKRQNGGKAPV